MKTKQLTILITAASLVCLATAALVSERNGISVFQGEGTNFTLNLDASTTVADYSDFTAYSLTNGAVNIKSTGLSAYAGGFGTLAAAGNFYNVNCINGIQSVTVVLDEGDAKLDYGVYQDDFSTEIAITSGVTHTLPYSANYFKVVAGVAGAKIKSLSIVYVCDIAKKYDLSYAGRLSEDFTNKSVSFNTKAETAMAGWGLNSWDTAALKAGFGTFAGDFTIEFDVNHIQAESNNHQYRFGLALGRADMTESYKVYDRFSMNNCYWNDSNEVLGIEYRALPDNVTCLGNAASFDLANTYGVEGDTKIAMSRVGTKQETIGSIPADANVVGHHKIVRTVTATGSSFAWTLLAADATEEVNVMTWGVTNKTSNSLYAQDLAMVNHYTGAYNVHFVAAGVNATFSNLKIS